MRWDEVKEEHIEAAARWIARALKGKDDALSFLRAMASPKQTRSQFLEKLVDLALETPPPADFDVCALFPREWEAGALWKERAAEIALLAAQKLGKEVGA